MNELISMWDPAFLMTLCRVMTPILFAALASTISSKSGVFNVGIEGFMLFSALFATLFSDRFQNPWIALLLVMLFGASLGLILAFWVIELRADPILVGTAINLMAGGATMFLLYTLTGDRGISTSLSSKVLPHLFVGQKNRLFGLGDYLLGHHVLTYLSWILVGGLHFFLYQTKQGKWVRAVGENKEAARASGIPVHKVQYLSLMGSGMLAGLGGAFLTLGYLPWFSREMTAGRGFIGLACDAMGGSTLLGSFMVSFVFGWAGALGDRLQLIKDLPTEWIQWIPYGVTIIGLSLGSYIRKKRNEKQDK